jgi:hypothetical protein
MEKGDSNDCFWEGKEGMGLIVGRTEGDGNNFEKGRRDGKGCGMGRREGE